MQQLSNETGREADDASELDLKRYFDIVRKRKWVLIACVVAGITMMSRRRFFTWSAVGAVLWVLSITLLGYFLGNVPKVGPFLSENIDLAIMAILAFSVIPVAYEWLKHRRQHGRHPRHATATVDSDVSDVEV